LSGEELIKRLEDEFLLKEDDRDNPILMKWLAACALPTEIFKDWVFFVGQILSPPHRKILSAENLQKFARLPWFRTGKMSETVRYTLISYLEKKHPNWYHTIQHEWYYVLNLEENLPPVGSIAWKGHRVQIILNELLQKPNRYDRADLEYELEELIKNDEEQDALVVKYEESTKGPLDSVLSSRFRKLIQKEERFRWRWRAWTWQLPVFTMMFLGATLIHSSETVTTFKFDDHISKLVFAPDLKQFLVGNGNFDLAVCFVSGGYKMGTKGKGKIVGLEYSEDGNSILSATTQNHQIFWDVSGVPIFSGGGENEVINAVDFHPENQFLAIKAFASGKAELWDLNKNILRASFPHNDNVYDVAFSPDGSQILTASRDHSAKLWDLSGNLLAEFSHDWFVYSVDFSPDGKYIATGCKDNTARIWSVSGALLHELKGHSYDVFDVEFSPSGKTLVSTTKRDVFLWNVSDGNWQRTFRGHNDFVKTAAFSPNGKLLLTGDASGIVKMWRLGIEK